MLDGKKMSDLCVPRSRVSRLHGSLRKEIQSALEPVLYGPPSRGEDVRRTLETEFAALVQQTHACAVHSGTIGLFLALRACGVGAGDEVVTVGNSDIATTAAITHCGAVPVLCDILDTDFTMDPDQAERAISPRTRAIVPVDLYGHPADGKRLRAAADRHGCLIVEDAALALGGHDHGRPVGSFADVAVFSFAPFKPLGCLGNGGMVTTNNERVAERLRLLSGYGHALDTASTPEGQQCYAAEGFNVPLDPLEAAILLVKLPRLAEWTARRQAIAAAYAHGLRGTPVGLPSFRPESSPTFRSYTVRVRNQAQVYQGLRRAGIEAALHYVPPIYRHPVYALPLRRADAVPRTDQLANELISLPVAPDLADDEIQFVIETLRAIVTAAQ